MSGRLDQSEGHRRVEKMGSPTVRGPGGAVGVGALAAEEAAARRDAVSAGRGKDTFGSDVLTAPQVIGDDEFEE